MNDLRELFDKMPVGGSRILLAAAIPRAAILRCVAQYNAELRGFWLSIEGDHHSDTVIFKREAWNIAPPETATPTIYTIY